MQITDIHQTSPGRLTVTLAGGDEIKSTLGVVTDMRLYSGREMDPAAVSELKSASLRALARERALEYLSRRPMSCAELKKKLIEKGEDEDVAEYCVGWLSEHGLIDDESYAAAVARHYAAKGYGPGRVRTEPSGFFQLRHFKYAVDGLALRRVNEAAGVNNYKVCAVRFGHESIARLGHEVDHLLAVYQILRAAKGNKCKAFIHCLSSKIILRKNRPHRPGDAQAHIVSHPMSSRGGKAPD